MVLLSPFDRPIHWKTQKTIEVRALFTAIELHSGKCVTLSQSVRLVKISAPWRAGKRGFDGGDRVLIDRETSGEKGGGDMRYGELGVGWCW